MSKEKIKKIIIDYIIVNKYDIINDYLNYELIDEYEYVDKIELEEIKNSAYSDFMYRFDEIIDEMKK